MPRFVPFTFPRGAFFLFQFQFLFLLGLSLWPKVASANDKAQVETFFPPPETLVDREFSQDQPWIYLAVGLSAPLDKGPDQETHYSYLSTGQISFRLPFYRLDLEAKYRYGQVLGDNFPAEEELDRKREQQGEILVGFGFPNISPGWRFIPRVGAYYATLNSFTLYPKKEKNLLSPQLSFFWIYEEEDQDLFLLNLKYIHRDKGNYVKGEGEKIHTDYGYGVEVGEIHPIGKGLGFIYNFSMENLRLTDSGGGFHTKTQYLLSFGLAY